MNNKKNGLMKNSLFYIVIFLGIMGMLYYFFGSNTSSQTQSIQSSQFITELRNNNVKDFTMQPSGSTYKITGSYRKAKKVKNSATNFPGLAAASQEKYTMFTTNVLTNDATVKQILSLAQKNDIQNSAKEEESSGVWIQMLLYFLPVVILFFFFYSMIGQAGQGGGGGNVM